MNVPTKQTARLARWYRSVAHGLFYFLTFAIPLLALPWTLDALEANKQTLLILGSALAMIAWLGAMVVERTASIRAHAWWLVLLLFFIGVIVSAGFSFAPFTSWVGQAGQEYTSVLSLIAFGSLLFIGAHALPSTMTQRRVFSALFVSSAIVALLALSQLASWSTLELVGTPYAMGTYLTIITTLAASVWLVQDPSSQRSILPQGWFGGLIRLAMLITMIGSTIVLLALDFWLFWVMLLIGTALLFGFALLRANEFPQVGRFVVPMALFVIALVFLFLPRVIPHTFSSELTTSYTYSWDVTTQTLAGESWAFGSGPGTYAMDYAKYHSTQINETLVWDKSFDRSASHLMTMLATFGAVPTLLYLILIIWLAGVSLMRLMKRSQPHDEWKITFVTFGGWTLSVIAQVFYPSNMTLSFLFWLLSAVLVSQVVVEERTFGFARSSKAALLTTFGFVVTNILLLTMLFVSGARYTAEIAFARAVRASEQGAQIDEVIDGLQSAAQFNRWSDVYQRNLAQAYLVKTAQLVADPEVQPSDVQGVVAKSIAFAQAAVDLSPSNVVNWSLLSDVYREVTPLVSGADLYAIDAAKQTTLLSPSNPKYFVALARAYLAHAGQLAILATSKDEAYGAQAESERTAALEAAIAALDQALVLKDDYATAYYYLALAYERSGDISAAIDRMVVLRDANPYDVGVAFQLGLLYLRQGKVDEAKTEFERAVTLAPNYANASWYLAAVYEELGDVEAAIGALSQILVSNPDNETVLGQIERLQAGLDAVQDVPEPLEGVDGGTLEEEGEDVGA